MVDSWIGVFIVRHCDSLSVMTKSGCLYHPTLHRFIGLLKMTGTCHLYVTVGLECARVSTQLFQLVAKSDNLIPEPEYLSASPISPPWKLPTLSLEYSHSSFGAFYLLIDFSKCVSTTNSKKEA